MIKRPILRRFVDAVVALVTWAAAAAAVLWFYDWLSRWYVVVGVLLGIVGIAVAADRLNARGATTAAALAPASAAIPLQREPEAAPSPTFP